MTRILALEGPDGCGKSTHADRLAAALRAEGVDAVAFHHAKPVTDDVVAAALDYARQRHEMVRNTTAAVIVADRWTPSTWCLGSAMAALLKLEHRNLFGLTDLAHAEARWLPRCDGALLWAPDPVLDARLKARGTPANEMHRKLREAYAWWAGTAVPRFDTSRPADAVAAGLLAWARGVLR
jgi:hypothetical protein